MRLLPRNCFRLLNPVALTRATQACVPAIVGLVHKTEGWLWSRSGFHCFPLASWLSYWRSLALTRARDRHKQEMRDLVRGRKPSPPQPPFVSSKGAKAAAVPVCCAYTPLANANPLAPLDESMMSRQQLQKKLLAEVHAANQSTWSTSRKPGSCPLQFCYVDADGVITMRNVSPYNSGYTNKKMEAWCDLLQVRRTFFCRTSMPITSLTG